MTYEWTKVELFGSNNDGDPIRFTCASGTAITKGTLLAMTDPRTAIAHSSAGQAIAGVAAMDKQSNDGSTTISAWTNGIFEVTASAAVTVGWPVISAAQGNTVDPGTAQSGAFIIGYAMESASAGEVINVRLKVGG